MAYQSETSRIMRLMAFHSPRTNLWGCTRACGMQRIGLRGAGSLRLTGLRLPLLHPIEGSMRMPVCGHRARLTVALHRAAAGTIKNWIAQVRRRWRRCSRSTWSTTTAMMWSASHKGYHLSAPCLDIYNLYERDYNMCRVYIFGHRVDN